MNYRINKFFARKNYVADTTIVEDLNLVDPISSIIIEISGVNTTDGMVANLIKCLTKIEIVDGSDVLYSLDGYEAEALDWYDQGGKLRSNYNWCISGDGQQRFIGLNFGRYLWDREYALDPKRFTNPQIRITLDVDAGGNTPSSLYVAMWANLFDQRIVSPVGFLMAKELKSWAIGSGTHEYTDLPLDYPYRSIYFRAFTAGSEPSQLVSNIKISEDQDKRIPYNLAPVDIVRCIAERYPDVEEDIFYCIKATASYIYNIVGERGHSHANQWYTAASTVGNALFGPAGGRLTAITSSGSINAMVNVKGCLPHCVYEIPCGMKDDPADWWDVRGLGSLKADITGGATASGYLFLQQARLY